MALPEGGHSGDPAEGAALIRQRMGGGPAAEVEPGGGKGENVGQGDGEGQAGGAFSFFFTHAGFRRSRKARCFFDENVSEDA